MKSSDRVRDAIDLRHGMEPDTESLSTSSPAPTAEVIPSKTASGDAEAATDATPDATIPESCSRLSAADAVRVLKAIRHALRTESGYDTCVERIEAIMAEHESEMQPPLSAADEQRLYRIRKDRANRFMVSAVDVDFLCELLKRLGA